ncbi:TatD family hydrolase [Candidatus Neptunochlamydia vexilliferae]|uniref:Deoxyribonuclease YabD n=1 Tax=Candidatus Neptunichlamydia vexilliferae TaxID=1651774 RepID=A0ABS0B0V5_9BACT|nr:TatD family hydrolase [Candidatus Neptunochlamydia vexilliferae]MBF5060020.1 putative deoxyribonuclease YabD [Candidatus Neptunochlamydia vexilliferae]
MFFDSHAHLTCDPVFAELEPMLERAKEAKVEKVMNICTDKISLERGIELAKKYPWVYNVGSTTPHDVEKEGGLYFPLFEEAARTGKLIAVGETGLDYHYEHSPKELQKTFLSRYFALATECHLPVVIHCRDAFDDLYAIATSDFPKGHAVIHCFTGTMQEAEQAVERGWMVSFSGIVTFKKSEALREVAKEIPLNHILIETDTPYLAPQSKRGKTNEPSFVPEVAQTIANVKGLPLEEVASMTTQNATHFFRCG